MNKISQQYMFQVDLLLRCLPHVASCESFALKGGTAINFFLLDMPRLSVDIDVTFLPIKDREESLQEIELSLIKISDSIKRAIPQISIEYTKTKKPLVFNFRLSYVNTSSSKHILYILRLLKKYGDKENNVQTYWYIEHGDMDTEEDVEDYMIITGLKIEIVKF